MTHFLLTSFIKTRPKPIIGLIIILLSVKFAAAQDFHLSQYDAPPMFLNPAMTGMFDGKYRIHAHYRTQWNQVVTNSKQSFSTAGISFDMPVKKYGLGIQVFNNRDGLGNYNVFSALISGAYDVVLDNNYNHHLAMGIQAGAQQNSVNHEKLSFGNQYTNENGGGFDQSISNGETFGSKSFTTLNANAGLLYYYAKDNSRLNPFVGLSVFNLTHPQQSFYSGQELPNGSNKLPIRYYIHGGSKVNISEAIQLLPKFIYMRQTNAQEITMTLLLQYYLVNSETYLIFGPTYRNKDAAVVEAGIKKEKYIARISYDINTSTLKQASDYRGGFEISLTYIARRSKPNPLANCPRL